MPHPQVIILGYSEAAMFAHGVSRPGLTGIISIHGAREFGVEAAAGRRIDLQFDDIEVAPPCDMAAMQRVISRRRWAQQNGLMEVGPTRADAAAVIEFAEALRGDEGVVLCHCGGGMSRAPAAALVCLAVWRGPGSEAQCVAEVRKQRPGAVPHVGFVRLADELLGREGRLVDAVVG